MSIRLNVHRQLNSTIRKFAFEELESVVIPNFPETSWSRLRSKLIKNHESFTVPNSLRIIEDAINKANLSDKVLKDRLATLELLEVSRHSKKKIWYAFVMKGQSGENRSFLRHREIQSRIIQNCRIHQMEIDVRVCTHEGITYVSMKDKPRGKEARRMMPVFFAFILEQPYIFCSRKSVTKEFVQFLIDSLGFSSAKRVKLMGRDLHSLIKMLWIKQQGAVQNELCNPPELKKPELVVKSTGIDFRQSRNRREYIQQCFGVEPPMLESVVATAPPQPWKDEEIRAKLPTERVSMSWEFRSRNIVETFTKFVEQRRFAMPLPNYVTNLMITGRNELTLRED